MNEQEDVGRKLANSPVSREIVEQFSLEFSPQIAWIILLKCLAIVASKLDWPRLSVLHVAPTRMFKSFTSQLAMCLFDEEFWIDLKSDFTMNSLLRYRQELEGGKCLFVHDRAFRVLRRINRVSCIGSWFGINEKRGS